ncbi:MAG: hypothetical protein ACKOI0_05955 [Actinomycetota bacterium]
MRVVSRHPDLSESQVRRMLAGLPPVDGYEVIVKPLRYRIAPHLSALTELDERRITLQIPEPFLPFGEVVPVGAVRRPGSKLRFIPVSEGVTFSTPRQVVRFLYLHEFMHCYLYARTGRGTSAETTCDRFALRNYRRRSDTLADAAAAARRPRGGARRP